MIVIRFIGISLLFLHHLSISFAKTIMIAKLVNNFCNKQRANLSLSYFRFTINVTDMSKLAAVLYNDHYKTNLPAAYLSFMYDAHKTNCLAICSAMTVRTIFLVSIK